MAPTPETRLIASRLAGRELADAAGVPAYVIFPDRTLIEMATEKPQSLDALRGITGVGAVKLEPVSYTHLTLPTN